MRTFSLTAAAAAALSTLVFVSPAAAQSRCVLSLNEKGNLVADNCTRAEVEQALRRLSAAPAATAPAQPAPQQVSREAPPAVSSETQALRETVALQQQMIQEQQRSQERMQTRAIVGSVLMPIVQGLGTRIACGNRCYSGYGYGYGYPSYYYSQPYGSGVSDNRYECWYYPQTCRR